MNGSRAQTPDPKRPKRPRDFFQAALQIVEEATAERKPEPIQAAPEPAPAARKARPKKSAAAVARGRLGGLASAKTRIDKISPERRAEIAKAAALARWGTKPGEVVEPGS
jgi:hypothetical protein